MYAHHFHLDDLPFSISPNPRFLYLSPRHHEALAHLLYGVGEGGGFVALTGEVGTGKTTLCNTLLEQLPENVDIALVLNPRLDPIELMQTLCDELEIGYPSGSGSLKVLGDALNHYLLEAHGRGRRTVVLIDEAQNLSFEVLEQVRLLTNLETYTEKLLQILLVGQPELVEILKRNELRQLNQRITARYHLKPLSEVECGAYVQHRLRVCGGDPELFTGSALRRIWKFSNGVPRLINVICDRSLLGAFAEGRHRVNGKIVRKSVKELSPPTRRLRGRSFVPLAATVFTGILLVAAAYLWAPWNRSGESEAALERVLPLAPVERRAAEPPPVMLEPQSAQSEDTAQRKPAVEESPAPTVETTSADTPHLPEIFRSIDVGALISESGFDLERGFGQLYRRWGIPIDDRGLLNCRSASKFGLECLAQRGNWNQLLRFNHPAILEFSSPAGVKHYALLTALKERDPVLILDDQKRVVPVGDLLPYWDGYFVMLWRPPAPGVRVLALGSQSKHVEWVRERIAADPLTDGFVETTGPFDGDLKTAVTAFQRRTGLAPDGIVGPHTLITLAAGQPDEAVSPRLRGGD